MLRKLTPTLLFAALWCFPAQAVTFEWAKIGNPGNVDDIHDAGFGSVDYTYQISKHEVTNTQYTEFLNAVAATDSFGGTDPTLYNTSMGSNTSGGITRSGGPGSYTYSVKSDAVGKGPGGDDYTYANKPVVFVSFFDAMRFTNWLHNGQGRGGTESGVYDISNGVSEFRSDNAKFWIPSEDEWYKSAYYNPNVGGGSGTYYNYPTGTDDISNNNLPSIDTGNSTNSTTIGQSSVTTGDSSYPLTDVGAYRLSESPYGTFDQGGNVWEWNESVYDIIRGRIGRGLRGGGWGHWPTYQSADSQFAQVTTREDRFTGFRLATVPEPSTLLLGSSAAIGLWMRRRTLCRFSGIA